MIKILLVCPFCRSTKIREYYLGPGNLEVGLASYVCEDCGLGFRSPIKIVVNNEDD